MKDRPPRTGTRWTVLYAAGLLVLLAGVVHPLRRHVEDRRQKLLGRVESGGRRLARASEFAFRTAAGASYRTVPGRPQQTLRDLPAEAALLLLGGFRGPYAVYLWMQVEEEKQEREHFALIERYHKIAALQPDYADVWVFHMWNMAWNVSVQWQSLERKYQWIRRAIEFGEEGHRRNPRNAEIMRALGHIYLDKLGKSQEAPYYRRRVWEDEGRSPFLIAYEWYDRARTAHDRYGTLTGALGKPVVYSQACHAATDYATELTLQAYGLLEEAARAKLDGREAEAAERLAAGRARLADAVDAWRWARREWHAHGVRWDLPGTAPELKEVNARFHNNAARAVVDLEAFRGRLTSEALLRLYAAAHTQDAYTLLHQSAERHRAQPGAGQFYFRRGREALDRAVRTWEEVVAYEAGDGGAAAASDEVGASGGDGDDAAPTPAGDLEGVRQDRAFLAALRTFRAELTYGNLDLYEGSWLLARAREDFATGLALRQDGRDEAAHGAVAAGRQKMAEATRHWHLARRAWMERLQALRAADEEPPAGADYEAWIGSADRVLGALTALEPKLSWEALPELVREFPEPPVTWPEPPARWPNRDLRL